MAKAISHAAYVVRRLIGHLFAGFDVQAVSCFAPTSGATFDGIADQAIDVAIGPGLISGYRSEYGKPADARLA